MANSPHSSLASDATQTAGRSLPILLLGPPQGLPPLLGAGIYLDPGHMAATGLTWSPRLSPTTTGSTTITHSPRPPLPLAPHPSFQHFIAYAALGREVRPPAGPAAPSGWPFNGPPQVDPPRYSPHLWGLPSPSEQVSAHTHPAMMFVLGMDWRMTLGMYLHPPRSVAVLVTASVQHVAACGAWGPLCLPPCIYFHACRRSVGVCQRRRARPRCCLPAPPALHRVQITTPHHHPPTHPTPRPRLLITFFSEMLVACICVASAARGA